MFGFKKIGLFIAVIVVIFVIYNLVNQIFLSLQSGNRFSQALEDLHKLEVKNKQLREQLSKVKTPEFIESQARDKLGLAKEGETVVVIPQSKIDAVLGVSKKIEEVKLPNPLGWLKVFWH